MLINGNTATIVLNRYRLIFVDRYLDVGTISGHGFINRVIYGFVHQVMKTFLTDITNIHCRAFTHRLKSFKHLDIGGRIIILVVLNICHFLYYIFLAKIIKKEHITK